MEYLHTNRTAHDHLRIVFNDRVVFLPLGDHATVGDVAQALRGFDAACHGDPVAIEVTVGDSPESFRASGYIPAGFRYEDDPAAEFEGTVSPEALFNVPDRASQFNA